MHIPVFDISPLQQAAWTDATVNIVGVDPGTSTVGFSLIEYSPVQRKIKRTMAMTINGAKMIGSDPFVETHGERVRRVAHISQSLLRLMHTFKPQYVAVEKPFFNMMRPGAFEPLLQGLNAVHNALWVYDPTMAVMPIDPPTAKKAVGAPGGAKKDQMLQAVCALKPLLAFDPYLSGCDLEGLDEHSIDAIAIGYWGLSQIT